MTLILATEFKSGFTRPIEDFLLGQETLNEVYHFFEGV